MPSNPDQETISKLFPNLKIEWLAGQGGMGLVYKAMQASPDDRYHSCEEFKAANGACS